MIPATSRSKQPLAPKLAKGTREGMVRKQPGTSTVALYMVGAEAARTPEGELGFKSHCMLGAK